MTSAFATKLATLACGLSEWLLEYYAGTRCFARLNFDNCDALTDVQALPIANHVLNEEEGDLETLCGNRSKRPCSERGVERREICRYMPLL